MSQRGMPRGTAQEAQAPARIGFFVVLAVVWGVLVFPVPALGETPSAGKQISRQHQLAPGVTLEQGSVAFFSDLHMAYGRANRKANPVGRKNMVAIANLFRTTPEVSQVVFGGDYYHAPNYDGLSTKQKAAALVRGLAGFKQRLGGKPLHVLFGNHDVPQQLQSGDARGYSAPTVKAMVDALAKKRVNVVGTDYDKSYKFRLPNGKRIQVGHAPNATSSSIAKAVRKMRFSTSTHTEGARAKMTQQPRPRRGEYVSGDSHVAAFSRGKATVVNLGTAGSGSRPIGDSFTVAIRQPTRGWIFLKHTPRGFVPYKPRGSVNRRRLLTRSRLKLRGRGRALVR